MNDSYSRQFKSVSRQQLVPSRQQINPSRQQFTPSVIQNSSRLTYDNSASPHHPNLKIVKTDVHPSGEAFQLVRPYPEVKTSSDEIMSKLLNQYDYKRDHVRAERQDLNTVKAAFPKMANKLLNTYDGSNIVADSRQDLIGDRYLAEQIRRINEENKKKSILDKWGHLLYEGEDEKTYESAYQAPILDITGLKPFRSQTFTINSEDNF